MRFLSVIFTIFFIAGCETTLPVWQQELNNINRQWRNYDDPIVYPERFKSPRDQYKHAPMSCAIS